MSITPHPFVPSLGDKCSSCGLGRYNPIHDWSTENTEKNRKPGMHLTVLGEHDVVLARYEGFQGYTGKVRGLAVVTIDGEPNLYDYDTYQPRLAKDELLRKYKNEYERTPEQIVLYERKTVIAV